jgi:hypothetical protein
MGGGRRIAAGLIVALLIAATAAGCGGGSSSSSSTVPSGGPIGTASFETKGEESYAVEFGKEASAAEREVVSKLVEESLRARAAGDWAGQCATLGGAAKEEMERRASGEGKGTTCAHSLGRLGSLAPKGALDNTMNGPIAALRVEGTKGYALYHGKGGKNYSLELIKEGGQWKVAALSTESIG